MLPKKNRLTGFEVSELFQKGQRHKFERFDIIVSPSPDKDSYKFSVATLKKLKLKAYERNRIRRRVYDAAAKIVLKQPINSNCLIVVKDRAIIKMSFTLLLDELMAAMTKAVRR